MVSTRRGATPQPSQAADATQPQPSSQQQQLTPPTAPPSARKKRVTASASKQTTARKGKRDEADAATDGDAAAATKAPQASTAGQQPAAGQLPEAAAVVEPAVASTSKPVTATKAAAASGGGSRRAPVAAEDDDESLLNIDMGQLAASIQQAVQRKQKAGRGGSGSGQQEAGPSGAGKGQDAAARDQDDEEPESSSDEEEEHGNDGNAKEESGADEVQESRKGKRGAAGKVANPLKGLRRWQPSATLPKVPASTRLVHQREPVQAEKEAGIAKQLLAPPRDPSVQARAARKAAGDTAGSSWYGMRAPVMNADLKRDLRLLKLRGAFDPKKFYKGFDATKLPKFFQMGTVVDNAVDFYGGRLTNSQRKGTLTEQLLADVQVTQARKKRYDKIQQEAQKFSKVGKVGGKRKAEKAPRATKNVKHKSR